MIKRWPRKRKVAASQQQSQEEEEAAPLSPPGAGGGPDAPSGAQDPLNPESVPDAGRAVIFDGDLASARRYLKGGIGKSDDFRMREFRLGGPVGRRALLAYLAEIVAEDSVEEQVIAPLLARGEQAAGAGPQAAAVAEASLISGCNVSRTSTYRDVLRVILEGNVALFIDGAPEILLLGASRMPHRTIDKPETEHATRGSREGFTDMLGINIALVRRRIKHPKLRVRIIRLGYWSRTKVAVLHVEGLTNPAIVKAVMARLRRIRVDQFQESQPLEGHLKDNPYTPFPTLRATERPDEAARVLLAGKVLIMADNTPFVLSVPSTLGDFYQTMEDYGFNYWGASLVRVLRFIGWMLSLYLPALYIAMIAVNPEMVPNELALTIAGAREGLPFPPLVEVVIIEVAVELIREAALRLPSPLGTTIGVVGGVVVGQAIVAAGVISPLMLIVAGITLIASFTTPVLDMGFPWRILKWLLVLLANMFGLIGIIVGSALILSHLSSLTSFGVPYLSPFSPLQVQDLSDSLVRAPFISMRRRPVQNRSLQPVKGRPYRQPAEAPSLRAAEPDSREGEQT
jgi:spore germination protein KA